MDRADGRHAALLSLQSALFSLRCRGTPCPTSTFSMTRGGRLWGHSCLLAWERHLQAAALEQQPLSSRRRPTNALLTWCSAPRHSNSICRGAAPRPPNWASAVSQPRAAQSHQHMWCGAGTSHQLRQQGTVGTHPAGQQFAGQERACACMSASSTCRAVQCMARRRSHPQARFLPAGTPAGNDPPAQVEACA